MPHIHSHSHSHSHFSHIFQPKFILTFSLLLFLPIIFLLAPRILPPRQLPISISDELDDLALFNRALSADRRPSSSSAQFFFRLGSTNPRFKIAFLFLTNSDFPFSPLWDQFFNSTSPDLFNIYIHADPQSRVSDPGGFFKDRFIPSKHTERASATLISAARRLLANAILDDSLNYYFALISQNCIPIHSFDYAYKSLFHSRSFSWSPVKYRSFIEILSNETTLHDRYNARGKNAMLPEVPFRDFRVGSQFFILTKKHALLVLRDRKLWRKFRLPCIRIQSCYPEEHYFPTLLSMEDPDGCTRFSLTRVNWTNSEDGHPHTYKPSEISPELIRDLRQSNYSYDYLFARKFSPECLKPLMDIVDDVILKD